MSTVDTFPRPDSDETFESLIQCFRLCGRFATSETLHVFTLTRPDELEALGLLKPASCGRWTNGWMPAGRLLNHLVEHRLISEKPDNLP